MNKTRPARNLSPSARAIVIARTLAKRQRKAPSPGTPTGAGRGTLASAPGVGPSHDDDKGKT